MSDPLMEINRHQPPESIFCKSQDCQITINLFLMAVRKDLGLQMKRTPTIFVILLTADSVDLQTSWWCPYLKLLFKFLIVML